MLLLCSYALSIFYFFFLYPLFLLSRNAYRAEVASFLVPVAGEDASTVRIRERIEFSSNVLFFIEDLYLALGPGHVTTQAGTKINVVASLLWVRNQHASQLKELMIAKKTGWTVLRNFKNQVFFILPIFSGYFSFLKFPYFSQFQFISNEPLEGFDFFDVLFNNNNFANESGFLSWISAQF